MNNSNKQKVLTKTTMIVKQNYNINFEIYDKFLEVFWSGKRKWVLEYYTYLTKNNNNKRIMRVFLIELKQFYKYWCKFIV